MQHGTSFGDQRREERGRRKGARARDRSVVADMKGVIGTLRFFQYSAPYRSYMHVTNQRSRQLLS